MTILSDADRDLDREHQAELEARRAEAAAARVEKRFRKANIPLRFNDLTLDGSGAAGMARLASLELIDRLCAGTKPYGKGIILWGPPGRGKSTIAVATLRDILRDVPPSQLGGGQAAQPNQPGYYLSCPSLMSMERRTWQRDEDGDSAMNLLDRIYCRAPLMSQVKVLVLDDVGKEHSGSSDFTQNVVHDLLRSRFDASAPTIVTTNLEPDEWRTAYGEATFSFIHEAFTIAKVGGVDHRRETGPE